MRFRRFSDAKPVLRRGPVAALFTSIALAALALTAGAGGAPAADASVAAPVDEIAFSRDGWVYLIRADGTGLRRLVRGTAPSWSPDGTRLLASNKDWIYVVSADGRNPRRLTRAGRGFSPAWSPDGERFAFVSRRSGQSEIYVANLDGSGVKRITFRKRRDEEAHSPAWSPDGRLIAFSSNRPTLFNPEIYVIRADRTGLRRLTRTGGTVDRLGDDGMPAWSPDGARIVFTSNRTQSGAVWAMNANGTAQRRLLDFPGTDEWYPRFAPSGFRIAFMRAAANRPDELWVMNDDGKGARKLAAGGFPAWRPTQRSERIVFEAARPAGGGLVLAVTPDGRGAVRVTNGGEPAVSPDGQLVAVARTRADVPDQSLYLVGRDGTAIAPITTAPGHEGDPAWAPDGRRIAYEGRPFGVSEREQAGDVYVTDIDGTEPVRLTDEPGFDGDPAFSPDGRRIAFVSDRDGNREIYVMAADGSGVRRLTANADVVGESRTQMADTNPRWSPNGRRIVFESSRDGDWEIYVMNVDGSAQRRLTRHRAIDLGPAFSPDGRSIVFDSDRGSRSSQYTRDLYVMRANGADVRRLTRLGGVLGRADWR